MPDVGVKPVKLALLLCDTPVPAVLKSRGTYLDVFRDQLQRSKPDASFPFTLDGFDVVNEQVYPDLDEGYTGVLISGSKYSAYDDDPWIAKLVEWVRYVATRRDEVKLIGICFGHQIVARALGGECVPNDGRWEVGTTDMELTDIGKAVFNTDRSMLPIQQMHRDHVPAVMPSFHLLGSTAVSPVQGLVRLYPNSSLVPGLRPEDVHILTVQGHPEFTSDIVDAIIDVREQNGAMNADVVREGRDRSKRAHEGTGIIGRAFWRILCANTKAGSKIDQA
ncbi:class I glutamine amidotransferase-like protein [Fomitiporia mediterranea MF3/22]|uniref:class I glutamine amidotransferase-like protein n=1 Tax=Fomitiporia mediterranea (strain MF3/22) TaxID=694068 RepID=UPI0004408DAD|nr:class I glutamine amidotransferase-like protein [Fomitiporia mediterranea MF3/22]EJD07897.1 class I glutamine amidotransferase-like protein [Fomitiporia mediterranea MF3/22]